MESQKLFRLDGKVALVTGASKGIGQAIAELYAASGAQVIVSSRKQEAIDSVVKSITDKGQQAHAIACNVSDANDLDRLVDQIATKFGRVDILVVLVGCGDGVDDGTTKVVHTSELLGCGG